jgi:hypothetical protein
LEEKTFKTFFFGLYSYGKHLVLVEDCHQGKVPHNNIFVNILCFDLAEATKIPMVKVKSYAEPSLRKSAGAILIVIFFPGMA